ncbi:MAG TPA: hypothetical protein DDX14_04905, partial [Cyanobacteria bacterium UBA9579]|nr:hypothetical protein [Cyanobacteria bacterium UBA9579]
MNRSGTNLSKLTLISYLVGFMSLSPALAVPSIPGDPGKVLIPNEIKLRGTIDDAQAGIQLKGGVKIDKNNQMINLNLRDSDIKQVLRMIADKAGVNIVFHDSVEGKITLDL